MNPNNNGTADNDNECAPLAERDYSDDPSASPQMDMKQMAEKIQALEANGHYKQIMTLVSLMIMAFCVAALLLKSCQMSEEISKMEENNTAMDKQINGLKNETREMQEQIKEIDKIIGFELYPITNLWNLLDCGAINISENRFVATLNSTNGHNNFVRTIWPIQALSSGHYKPSITFYYFEVEFLINKESNVYIGFYTKGIPFYDLGIQSWNSIGIGNTEGIWIDSVYFKFGNAKENFKQGDVVGLGIIHSPPNSSITTKCFATLNGKLLGKVDLPPKFAMIESIRQLYPAVSIYNGGDSIRANFGNEPFRFNVSTEHFL